MLWGIEQTYSTFNFYVTVRNDWVKNEFGLTLQDLQAMHWMEGFKCWFPDIMSFLIVDIISLKFEAFFAPAFCAWDEKINQVE